MSKTLGSVWTCQTLTKSGPKSTISVAPTIEGESLSEGKQCNLSQVLKFAILPLKCLRSEKWGGH